MTEQEKTEETGAKARSARARGIWSQIAVWGGAVALLAIGGATFVLLVLTPVRPAGEPDRDPGRLVRVLRAQKGAHRASVKVYGTSRASQQWTAIAEVRGKALFVEPQFEPGEILKADTLLVSIDTEEFTLTLERLEAEKRSQEQLLIELGKTEDNLKEIRELQDDQLELAAKEVARQESLAESNVATEQDVETARGAHLSRLLAWQETTNALALIPVRRDRANATLEALDAQLREAQRKLSDCEIRLPYDARCASKSIEVDQYVGLGERLGVFLAMDTAEVVAMAETRRGASLFPRGVPGHGSLNLNGSVPEGESPLQEVLRHISAEVHWGSGKPWTGRVTRIGSSLDRETRSVPVVVEVADPYTDIIPGVRPPLVPDAFCEVTLYGDTVDDVVVIPRDCLHEVIPSSRTDRPVSVVYVLAGATESGHLGDQGEPYFDSGRLEIRPVTVLLLEEEVAVIEKGIDDGDLIVLGDLYPASDGMLLRGLLTNETETTQ